MNIVEKLCGFGTASKKTGIDSCQDRVFAKMGFCDMVKCGLSFYNGCFTVSISYKKYASFVNASSQRIGIRISEYSGALVTVEAEGKNIPLAWEPYYADITKTVHKKETLYIKLVNSRRNSFGPLHIVPPFMIPMDYQVFIPEGILGVMHILSLKPRLGQSYLKVPRK